jgi:pimeloyl-ACP methyl ester carboxylesterase
MMLGSLRTLVVEPPGATQVLLFLHGKLEASDHDLELVCKHGSPPHQARAGHYPRTIVLAPQAPPRPNIDQWNWGNHVDELACALEPYRGRLVGTGFSRGGRGIMQLVAHAPGLLSRWAAVDPASVSAEVMKKLDDTNAFDHGWAAFGTYEPDRVAHPDAHRMWMQGRADLKQRLPAARFVETRLDHVSLSAAAYGDPKLGLHASLGIDCLVPDRSN